MFVLASIFQEGGEGGQAIALISNLCGLVIAVVIIAGLWKIFAKAGKPGWAAIVPIYNYIVLLEIVGRPVWWIILLFIPFVNLIIVILLYIDLAKSFGKGAGYGILMLLLAPIMIPVLGFGPDQYVGPAVAQG